MSFVSTLLQAIVRLDGEAVVMHVGEKPYVVTPTGQVDLATRGLNLDAVIGIVNQLLPPESQTSLDEFGAVQYELPAMAELPDEHFTIVAARGGDDVWAEIRRRRVSDDDRVPVEFFGGSPPSPAAPPAAEPSGSRLMTASQPPGPPIARLPEASQLSQRDSRAPTGPAAMNDDLEIPDVEQLWPGQAGTSSLDEAEKSVPEVRSAAPPSFAAVPPLTPVAPRPSAPPPPVAPPPAPPLTTPASPAAKVTYRSAPSFAPPAARSISSPPPAPTPVSMKPTAPPVPQPPAPARPATAPPARIPVPAATTRTPSAPPTVGVSPPLPAPPPQPAVVLPLTRGPIRPDVPPPLAEQPLSGLEKLLRLAAARGASILYLSSEARPAIRIDGDVQTLDGAPVLGPNDVEALLLTLMPERSAEALRTGLASEWICDVPDIGRVRCMSFRDHRGPGGVFRMMPTRVTTVEQLGLTREIQSLAIEPEGLVLVAGPRSSGKRTLISALVDLINRVRRDHVITIEHEINVVHERGGSFVSQREVRGSTDEMLAVARAALREDPDVLVLEEVRTAGLMNLALDRAASGQLVIGGFPAPSASGAIDRIIDLYPPEYRRQVQLSLAQNLRGVVAQVLLKRTGGGRVAARDVLLNTPAVRSVLAEGKTSQLPLAIEGGRVHGMVPLNDALVGYVLSGTVDVREAYRRAADRAGFLALLKRQGVDTSAVERYA